MATPRVRSERRRPDAHDRGRYARPALRAAGTLGLLLWLIALPLAQGLHLQLAPHGHRFCDAHQAFEDVERHEASPSQDPDAASGATHDEPGTRLAAMGSGRFQPHQPCAVLSSASSRTGRVCAEGELRAGPGPATLALAPERGRKTAGPTLLLGAPKQSPPPFRA